MIEITDLRREDYGKAIDFAIKGMHFDWYLNSPLLLKLYGRYFWYLEMSRATQILAAYVDGSFVGVLLAEIYGEPVKHRSVLEKIYVKQVDIIQKIFFKGGAGVYEDITKAQAEKHKRTSQPDGELIFLAADPDAKVKGVGTALLNGLIELEKGKRVYLHTDDACTWQFYERRGFECVDKKEIVLEMPKGRVPLKCLLYSRIL